MLHTKLPQTRYNTTTYPTLESRADGAPIPIAYGDLHGVIPVCINTGTYLYKLAGHAIHSIDAVRSDTETLIPGTDYSVDLANAEFSLISTPYLEAGKLYYFVVEASYASGTPDYIQLRQDAGTYADGQVFSINGAGVWTPDAAHDLRFWIYGKSTLSDQEVLQICSGRNPPGGTNLGLKDTAARTRLAQSFLTGVSPFYCTRIQVRVYTHGSPTGTMQISVLSGYNPAEVQVGVKSLPYTIDPDLARGNPQVFFPLQSDISNLTCDIEGAEKTGATIVDGADMLEDLIVTRLGKPLAILDPATLANFKTKRTQEIAAYIDCDDMTFGDIVGKLESSLLVKLVPLQDQTYAPIVYEGDTSGDVRPHFFDEHFLSFSMRHDFAAVKSIIKVKYDENPSNDEFKVAEADSDVAHFVYGMEETLEVETYLSAYLSGGVSDGTDAEDLANSYLGMYETPPVEITFEIRGYGLDLIPGRDKVRITRTRAAYAGGALNDVLFRIVKITKRPGTASTEIVAVLDTQTY